MLDENKFCKKGNDFQMKALQGLKASFRLQEVLNKNAEGPIRGIRNHDDNNPQSLNAFLYTVLRPNRQYRRGLLTSLLNLFDDSAVSYFT